MQLKCVTMTGADDSVNSADLVALSNKYAFVEWAILVSKSREGGDRYPTHEWVNNLEQIQDRCNLAVHLCGQWSREFLSGNNTLFSQWRWAWNIFQRIQINAVSFFDGMPHLEKAALDFPEKKFIQPVRSFTEKVAASVYPLFDQSGGRGRSPSEWPRPLPGLFCGYAGGLGPDNLREALDTILGLSEQGDCWVDMESGLRSQYNGKSVFDLEKVEKCLDIASRHVS